MLNSLPCAPVPPAGFDADALPERYRNVLVMRGGGLTPDEIGRQLSMSHDAVADLLGRARTRMSAELALIRVRATAELA